MKRMVTAAVVAAGIVLTGVAGWFSYQAYRYVEIEQASLKTDNAASSVRLALDRVALAVRAVRAMYAADWVTPDQFQRFARTLAIREGFRSLGFYRRVVESERARYEAAMTTEPGKSLGIWRYDDAGKPVRAPEQPVYYVVESGYLLSGENPAYGLDVTSLPGRTEMIEQATRTFELVISQPLQFAGSADRGVIFYVPALDRSGSIVGVATGTLTFDELSKVAVLTSGAVGVRVEVDVDKPNQASPLSREAEASSIERIFNFGGRTWTVSLPVSSTGGPLWLVLLVVGAGVATTAAVAAYLVGLTKTAEVAEARSQLSGMLDGLGPLAWLLRPDGQVIHANRTASELLGRPGQDLVGHPFWDLPLPGDRAAAADKLRAAIRRAAGGEDIRFDLTLADGEDEERVYDLWIRSLPHGDGPPSNLVASAVDITDRHEGEQTQRLLMRELDHRMKNTLQVIQAVIRRTARAQGSVATFERSLLGRVGAMSRAHDLLAQERWLGADIGTIVNQEIGTFETGGAIRTSGPSMRLNPRAALSVALAIHELGTNAAKYGALSVPEGKISMTWSIDRTGGEAAVTLRWEESGGPEVTEPENKGFGSMLIERSIAYELEGEATIDYRRDGLICVISIPLRMLRPFVAERTI